jgi:hypothetical protein
MVNRRPTPRDADSVEGGDDDPPSKTLNDERPAALGHARGEPVRRKP